MIASLQRTLLASALTLAMVTAATAAGTTANVDMGAAPSSQPASATLTLALRNQAQLETFIAQSVSPGSPNFHHFLSTAQFASRYGATDAQIAKVQAFLTSQGLRSEVMPNHMTVRVSGTLGQFNKAFETKIHNYRSRAGDVHFRRPVGSLTMPAGLAGSVTALSGLDTGLRYRSHRLTTTQLPGKMTTPAGLKAQIRSAASTAAASNPTSTGEAGSYTVGDVADQYNINPLYKHGITGKGTTVAIVTLADFDPADATTYWDTIGLKTKPNRIKQIRVDGGAPINGGSGETALDVEQSGGLAPDADVLVYDAPNAGSGFIDAMAQAVSDNIADSISTSWGSPELYNFAAINVDGADPTDTTDAGDLQAFHQVLMEAAAQGQSVFAASGDSGAYDTVRGLPTSEGFSTPLSIDAPANDPYMTAAGGTTLPFSYSFRGGPTESIKKESVWGWSYLQDYFDKYVGKGVIDLFSVGGGGGVSVYWPRPLYQWFTPGIKRSEPKQALTQEDPAGLITYVTLPGNFPGRNVPDISLNADPETGYLVYSTVDGGLTTGNGGTSFVSPQLNGISALLTQSAGHRVGFWNPQVYLLQLITGYGYFSPFNAIKTGDNWFYKGQPRYNQGSGLGSIDVNKLDKYIKLGLRF